MDKSSLGDRMKKNYENRYRQKLIRRIPVIMRLDGKSFTTLTHHCVKPFDEFFSYCMTQTAIRVCQGLQEAKYAYIQSDEISILLTDFETHNREAWFDYNIQKMCSIASGIASAYFTTLWFGNKTILWTKNKALRGLIKDEETLQKYLNSIVVSVFDCRVFNIPKEEVCNYFIWRQKDWERNSIQMLSRAHYSHKDLMNKNREDMHEMLYKKGVNWSTLPNKWKKGSVVFKGMVKEGEVKRQEWVSCYAPIFTSHRYAVERYLNLEETE